MQRVDAIAATVHDVHLVHGVHKPVGLRNNSSDRLSMVHLQSLTAGYLQFVGVKP
jgi:hypothetical protein